MILPLVIYLLLVIHVYIKEIIIKTGLCHVYLNWSARTLPRVHFIKHVGQTKEFILAKNILLYFAA